MRKKVIISIYLAAVFILMFTFSGCDAIKGLTNKVPEEYTEGIKYDRAFPDDVLEIYEDAIVFDSKKLFDEIILTLGTEDDFDDVVDFYKEFFEENGIVPSEEAEDKDEYYARGVYEGYEFKLQIAEADGEYVEDLFECVVYLSAKETDKEALKASAEPTATPAPSEAPTATAAATATAAPTAAPTATPAPDNSGETPLTHLGTGSWELMGMSFGGQFVNDEMTIYINDASTGTLYSYIYDTDERGFFDFTYEISNGYFIIYVDGDTITYKAYFDDGVLHLSEAENELDMYFANWSENYGVNFSDSEFTAYGDWIYYEPDTGYVETIAFWPDGSGYIYNWGGNWENRYMFWEFADGQFTIYDDQNEEYTYGIAHRGEVFELRQLNGSVFFYNRVSGNYWLSGTFYLDDTNDETVSDWTVTFSWDGTCDYTLNGATYQSYWYIDNATGKLVMGIGEYDFYFDYHYDLEGLHFWNPEGQYYYRFLQVG